MTWAKLLDMLKERGITYSVKTTGDSNIILTVGKYTISAYVWANAAQEGKEHFLRLIENRG